LKGKPETNLSTSDAVLLIVHRQDFRGKLPFKARLQGLICGERKRFAWNWRPKSQKIAISL